MRYQKKNYNVNSHINLSIDMLCLLSFVGAGIFMLLIAIKIIIPKVNIVKINTIFLIKTT